MMIATTIAALTCLATLATASAKPPRDPERPNQVDSALIPGVGPISIERIAGRLEHPWGLAFLPDGRMLVTERPGRLVIVTADGTISKPIPGTPTVFAQEQGGLLDVALDPNFDDNQFVYFTYAKPGADGTAAAALGRGRFANDRIEDFKDLFVQTPWIKGGKHFGSRIAFSRDAHIFMTLGERFQFQPAQELSNHLGKVVRLKTDGSAPDSNPFVRESGAKPEIWSYGHRNLQAAAVDPATGELWIAEMGPLGGDELNNPQAGKNYGWPVVSWGMNYDATDYPDPPTRPEFTDAVRHWSPVISPSGMIFYTGDVFPAWRGSAFIGGLSGRTLVRVVIKDGRVVEEDRIPMSERIRDVEQGPDGLLYLLVDKLDGELWRIKPLKPGE